jgi:hypothetical protein
MFMIMNNQPLTLDTFILQMFFCLGIRSSLRRDSTKRHLALVTKTLILFRIFF